MRTNSSFKAEKTLILSESEPQGAWSFGEAAKTYANMPVALRLRAMNMLYEGLKTNSTIVIVSISAIETMQLGELAGLTALTMGIGQDKALGATNNQSQMNRPPEGPAVMARRNRPRLSSFKSTGIKLLFDGLLALLEDPPFWKEVRAVEIGDLRDDVDEVNVGIELLSQAGGRFQRGFRRRAEIDRQ